MKRLFTILILLIAESCAFTETKEFLGINLEHEDQSSIQDFASQNNLKITMNKFEDNGNTTYFLNGAALFDEDLTASSIELTTDKYNKVVALKIYFMPSEINSYKFLTYAVNEFDMIFIKTFALKDIVFLRFITKGNTELLASFNNSNMSLCFTF